MQHRPIPRAAIFSCVAAACALTFSAPVSAADVTLYGAQGIDANLLEIPELVLTGDLVFEKSYFVGLGYHRPLATPSPLAALARSVGLSHVDAGMELISVKHFGRQDHYESDIAYFIGLPPATFDAVAVRFRFGIGLSYAHGTPTYEDGPEGDPDRRYRLLNFNAYELEWFHPSRSGVRAALRLHHRSGIYGLIAPRRVGSNFVTVGVRSDF